MVYNTAMFNPYIAVPVAVWAITQLAKFTVTAIRGNLDLRNLYASGGMPSVHSAVVCSLATTALVVDGYSSHLFGFTLVFAGIVMYDSLGVRRAAGEQGAAINMIVASLRHDKVRLDEPDLEVREVMGHRPNEVAVGALVGIFFALLFNYQHIQPLINWLGVTPSHIELFVYLAIAVVLILGGVVQQQILRRRGSETLSSLGRRLLLLGETIGILLGVFAVCAFEKVDYLSSRFCFLASILIFLIWGTWLYLANRHRVPAALALEAEAARKEKWLPKGKKNKRKKR
jgi:acid phosphatase family membrane protein YuiD